MSKIILGDSAEKLMDIPDNSVDQLIADPPYRYEFMGKKWDAKKDFKPIWKECFRTMKPGAFGYIMNAPRSDCQLLLLTELAEVGFNIKFSPIYWTYASGFPKAANMSKLIDNSYFNKWFNENYNDHVLIHKENLKVAGSDKKLLKQIKSEYSKFKESKKPQWALNEYGVHPESTPYTHPGRKNRSYQTKPSVFSGDRKGDKIKNTRKSPYPGDHNGEWDDAQILNLPKWEEHRNTSKTRQNPFQSGKNMMGKKHEVIQGLFTTNPSSPEAKKMDGSYAGFQPKPAVEIINVVMKPLSEKSYIDQALENGKGVSWFDDCRVPYEEVIEYKRSINAIKSLNDINERIPFKLPSKEAIKNNSKGYCTPGDSGIHNWNNPEVQKLKKKMVGGRLAQEKRWTYGDKKVDGFKPQEFEDVDINLKGRFPANLLISDNILDSGKNMKTGAIKPYKWNGDEESQIYGGGKGLHSKGDMMKTNRSSSEGDFSRYFSLDAWWGEHVKNLPKELRQTFPFLYCPKPTKKEKNKGLSGEGKKVTDGRKAKVDNAFQRGETVRKNTHPTGKPIKLMSYLITLGSRPKDLILDPFAGSGTTGIACKLEDRQFILIEKDEEYFQIMKARLRAHKTQKKLF